MRGTSGCYMLNGRIRRRRTPLPPVALVEEVEPGEEERGGVEGVQLAVQPLHGEARLAACGV